jgi:hypothetical protein
VESALQQRFYPLVEFVERGHACDHLAIDEKGRRPLDLDSATLKARRVMSNVCSRK